MELLFVLIKDLVIIGIVASFCDLLLPESEIRRPVQLIFGLYFMALMLNPLVSLFQDTDLSVIDFESLAEEKFNEMEYDYSEDMVYQEAANTLSQEIEGRLGALYHDDQVTVSIRMNVDGFQKVKVNMSSAEQNEAVLVVEIKEFLASEYGIPGNVVSILIGKG